MTNSFMCVLFISVITDENLPQNHRVSFSQTLASHKMSTLIFIKDRINKGLFNIKNYKIKTVSKIL